MRSCLFLSLASLSLVAACGAPTPAPVSSTKPTAAAASAAPVAATTPHGPQKPAYPPTPKRAVADSYGSTTVVDEYQWLESPTDPMVKEWSTAQNAFTRARLDAIPSRAALLARTRELLSSRSPSYFDLAPRGKVLFALKSQPPKQQPLIVALASLDDPSKERVVVDPNAIDPSGKTSIDYFSPSPDGKLVAVSLSSAGTELGDVHVYETATGKARPDVVPRANSGTAGGSLAWTADNAGFYFTRHPHDGERPAEDQGFFQQVYYHKLGTPEAKDRYALGKDGPRIAEWFLKSSDDGKNLLAVMQYGDGGDRDVYALVGAKWEKIAQPSDEIRNTAFGRDGKIYLVSRKGAPHGKVLRVDAAHPAVASAEVVVPEGDGVIEDLTVTQSRLYVVDLVGGPSQIRDLPLRATDKNAAKVVATPPVSSVPEIVAFEGDDVLFKNESYTDPAAWYRFKASDGKTTKTALAETSTADFGDSEVVRETCTSRDGTKVPVNIVRKKGTVLDGTNPVLLTGYGGYGLSRKPKFRPSTRVWLDQGGVWAEANIRGGGEFGEAWHKQGNLTQKQNVFDDFAGCAQHVIDARYTRPEKLAIIGGSNGGTLMGAELTQHPELFRAVIAFFGVYDSLRSELAPNGAFNVTEFGSVKDPQQLQALLGYSPLHHVKDGTAYPAVLFLTGENDPRVPAWHSRKFVARLQTATSSARPILLRTSGDTGHVNSPLSAEIDQLADVYAFLFSELGVDVKPAK